MKSNIDTLLSWALNTLVPIIAIILITLVIEYIGEKIFKMLIRRSVHGHHFGRPHQSAIDVRKRQETILSLLAVILKTVTFITAAGFILLTLFPKIDLVPIFASAGVLGAIIGFGAQSIIKDVLAGIFIIAENQLRVGDVVDIEGAAGTVEHITLRSTAIRDISGNVHYITNGNIIHIINKTMGYSRVNFVLAVEPNTNVDSLSEIINEVGQKMADHKDWKDKITEAPHFINLGAFSNTALEINIGGKTIAGEQWTVTSEMKKRLLKELQKHPTIVLSQYQDLTNLTKK